MPTGMTRKREPLVREKPFADSRSPVSSGHPPALWLAVQLPFSRTLINFSCMMKGYEGADSRQGRGYRKEKRT